MLFSPATASRAPYDFRATTHTPFSSNGYHAKVSSPNSYPNTSLSSLPFKSGALANTSKRKLNTQSPKAKPDTSAKYVSEIVLPYSSDSLNLILPSLAHISKCSHSQWLTWITDKPLPIDILKHYDFNLNKVRVIYAKDSSELYRLTAKALKAGTSEAVVSCLNNLSNNELDSLNAAGEQGNSKAVLVRFSIQ